MGSAGLVPLMEPARESGLRSLAGQRLSVPTDKGASVARGRVQGKSLRSCILETDDSGRACAPGHPRMRAGAPERVSPKAEFPQPPTAGRKAAWPGRGIRLIEIHCPIQ